MPVLGWQGISRLTVLNGDNNYMTLHIILKGRDQSMNHLNLHLRCTLLLLSWPYHHHLCQHMAELHILVCEGAFSLHEK